MAKTTDDYVNACQMQVEILKLMSKPCTLVGSGGVPGRQEYGLDHFRM